MSGWWGVLLVGGGALVWFVVLDLGYDVSERLARWWVGRAQRWPGRVGPRSLGLSAVVLMAYVGLALVGRALGAQLGDPRWGLLISGPALLAYTPFMLTTAPLARGGYQYWRDDLRAAGADPALQRRIAWWAGVPSFVGMVVALASLVLTFVR